ncbi:MAG: nucleotidyltransferase family protein [Bacteroidetes Order II. Incertae sedis bacterium]|nr:nucleotidyltransferase family protein [Bacteroidetes Order II. bacterium]
MKAMIFAAGLGTRLRPLTESVPKALVEVNGTPLLGLIILRLKRFGFKDLIINVHHFPDMIVDYLAEHDNFGVNITISDEREALLETGGGLQKAAWFFDDGKPFLVHNVDILSDLNLLEIYEDHIKSGALATLAVSGRKTSRVLLFDEQEVLCGWRNLKTGEEKWARPTPGSCRERSFSGIHVICPEIFSEISQTGRFSIIDTYLELGGRFPIKAHYHDESHWMDVGKPETLQQAVGLLAKIEAIG